MTKPPDDLAAVLNELPLFPLKEVVLFPGVLLTLHVFEPRYRQLIGDVLETHRSLSVVQVPDADADMSTEPPIADVATVGTIVEHMKLPGDRYNIVLLGRARVRLQELRFAPPYRRALATMLESTNVDVPGVELAAMHASVASFSSAVRKRDASFSVRLPKEARAGAVADACAHHLVLDARDRQKILETLDVRKRVSLVTEILTVQAATLAPAGGQLN